MPPPNCPKGDRALGTDLDRGRTTSDRSLTSGRSPIPPFGFQLPVLRQIRRTTRPRRRKGRTRSPKEFSRRFRRNVNTTAPSAGVPAILPGIPNLDGKNRPDSRAPLVRRIGPSLWLCLVFVLRTPELSVRAYLLFSGLPVPDLLLPDFEITPNQEHQRRAKTQ